MPPAKKFYSIRPGESLEELKKKKGLSLCELLDALDRAEEQSESEGFDVNQQLTYDNLSEDDREAQARLKKLMGALNKLAPDNFYIQLMEIQDYVPIHSSHLMRIFVNQLVEKAIDEEFCSPLYANICKALKSIELLEVEDETIYNFGAVVLEVCYNIFCYTRSSLNWFHPHDPSENDLVELELKESMKKRKLVGVLRFLGHLFKAGMIDVRDVFQYIKKLEQDDNEKSIEGLCKLLTTAGKELETAVFQSEFQEDWCTTWERIVQLSKKERGLPLRSRFMLMNLLDLMNSGWVPRIPTHSPKTFKEILIEHQKTSSYKNDNGNETRFKEANKTIENVITNDPVVIFTETEILQILKRGSDDTLNLVSAWEIENFKGRKTWFIYSLTRAILKYSVEGNTLNKTTFMNLIALLKKYINSRQGELACMYAVQCVLVSQMGNPKGLIEEVCDILHKTSTISYIAFLDWRENWSNSPILEVSGKAEAQISLATFFVRLFWESIKPSSQYKSIVKELNSFDLEQFVSMSKLPPEIGKRIKMEEEREKNEFLRREPEETSTNSLLAKSY